MLQLAAAEGYESITVRKLARLAGVSTASFYARFDGKDECFINSCTLVLDRIRRRVQKARSHRHDPQKQLALTVEALLAEPTMNPDAARVALVEAFGGGPAAIARIRDFEAALEAEVKANLSRRGDTPSTTVTTWITAGYFQVCRKLLVRGVREQGELVDGLASWGMSHLKPANASTPPVRVVDRRPVPPQGRPGPRDFEEREAILAAVTRLATKEGYWGLTEGAIRKQAGVSRAVFRAHFGSVEDCYLAAARDLINTYLSILIVPRDASVGPAQATYRGVHALTHRLSAEPEKAKFAFLGVLDAGAAGLHLRERMIAEFAAKWRDAAPAGGSRSAFAAEATIAALWGVIAQRIEGKAISTLPTEASTLTFLLLAPSLAPRDPRVMKHESPIVDA